MGLRFRRSVRLFPGVRLNFSGSGVSTSIGVRGASMTFGHRGTYANVGIPGSGFSYRTRIDTPARSDRAQGPGDFPAPPHRASHAPIVNPGVATIPGTEKELRSADVGTLTSPGLTELKQLINDATRQHSELRAELAKRTEALNRAAKRLRRAELLVIRLFTGKSIPRLVDAANYANDAVDDIRDLLEGCFVEVDYGFSDATRQSYAALLRAFESLSTAQRIWDVTTVAAVDRVAQRTTAFSALTRVPVQFSVTSAEIVRSKYAAMRLGNASGPDLQIYAGFVMMRDASGEFDLIEFREFECQLAQSQFIEEEPVPSDAEHVGATWKRANKDGSRDRRFNGNYQIPIVRYGGFALSSPTGLAEVYQVSNFPKAAAFVEAIDAHKRELSNLTTPSDLPALPAPTDSGDNANDEDAAQEPAFVAKPRKGLAADWITLAASLAGIGFGLEHLGEARSLLAPSAAVLSASVPPNEATIQRAATLPKIHHSAAKTGKHRNHHRRPTAHKKRP